jgi:hypothetical protein
MRHERRPTYGLGVDSTALLLRRLEEPGCRDFPFSELPVVTAMTGVCRSKPASSPGSAMRESMSPMSRAEVDGADGIDRVCRPRAGPTLPGLEHFLAMSKTSSEGGIEMKAILIPERGDPEVIEQDGLADLQRLVGGFIESVHLPGREDAVAYINETGKLSRGPNEAATVLLGESLFPGDWIAGPCVIAGADPATGENLPVPEDMPASLGVAA